MPETTVVATTTLLEQEEERLQAFGIPPDPPGAAPAAPAAGETGNARAALARLLASGALSLGTLQTLRDLLEAAGPQKPDVAAGGAVFLAAMFLSLDAGNTYMATADGPGLWERAGTLAGPEEATGNRAFLAALPQTWQGAVRAARRLAASLPAFPTRAEEVLGQPGVVCVGGEAWYFQRVLLDVLAVRQGVEKRLPGAASTPAAAAPRYAEFSRDGQTYALNPGQREAVGNAANRRFAVITGGPGTGKTTVVCSLVAELLAANPDWTAAEIALAAPTGRAAQRLGEALHAQAAAAVGLPASIKEKIDALNGSTIHRLLGGYPPRWQHHHGNPLPHQLVVVDEASMVDVGLMAALLDALPDAARLVLLGDNDQLPAVGAGAVLGDFVANLARGVVATLSVSQRFDSNQLGSLGQYAAAVNDGHADVILDAQAASAGGGALFADAVDGRAGSLFPPAAGERQLTWLPLPRPEADARPLTRQILADVRDWAERFGWLGIKAAKDGLCARARAIPANDPALTRQEMSENAQKLFAALNRARLLCVVRDGPCGATTFNRYLALERCGRRNPLEHVGVPVIVTRNAPVRNLFNGDLGVTAQGENGMVALFPRGERVIACPVGLLPEHELAYAITVHKSQGSEFANVLVALPPNADNPLLNRQLLYTGITRARERAGIVGTEEALRRALAARTERRTGVVGAAGNAPGAAGGGKGATKAPAPGLRQRGKR